MTFQDLQNRVYFLTGTDSTSFSLANLNLAVNRGIERVVSLINHSDSRWQFDDSNYADLPMATLAITSGQQQYSLATSHLSVDRIERKDLNGNWQRLIQIDPQDLKRRIAAEGWISGQIGTLNTAQTAIAEGEATPATGRGGAYRAATGVPLEYDIIGIRLFLFPVPNYTQAASLRIYFTRAPLLYDYTASANAGRFSDASGSGASADTLGFVSLFHDLVALWAAYDYGLKVGKQNTMGILSEIQRKEQELVDFYGGRNRDYRARFTVSYDSNR